MEQPTTATTTSPSSSSPSTIPSKKKEKRDKQTVPGSGTQTPTDSKNPGSSSQMPETLGAQVPQAANSEAAVLPDDCIKLGLKGTLAMQETLRAFNDVPLASRASASVVIALSAMKGVLTRVQELGTEMGDEKTLSVASEALESMQSIKEVHGTVEKLVKWSGERQE